MCAFVINDDGADILSPPFSNISGFATTEDVDVAAGSAVHLCQWHLVACTNDKIARDATVDIHSWRSNAQNMAVMKTSHCHARTLRF